MDARERMVVADVRCLYCVAAVLIAMFVPSERDVSRCSSSALCWTRGVSQVRFEFGIGFVVPEQLVVIPMLILLPLPYVPIRSRPAGALGLVPDFRKGSWAKDRWLKPIADSGPTCRGPYSRRPCARATRALGPPIYALAILAQLATDFAQPSSATGCSTAYRSRTCPRLLWRAAGRNRPLPGCVCRDPGGHEEPLVLVAVIAPLVWLLDNFSKDRAARTRQRSS